MIPAQVKLKKYVRHVVYGCLHYERHETRLTRSQPILDAFSAWLDEQADRVLPKSALGNAIKYCRNQWPRLVVFLESGCLELDNNRGERAIKPFVVGRKNLLFSNTIKGAKSSAVIYSVMETAKANGLNPFNFINTSLKHCRMSDGYSCVGSTAALVNNASRRVPDSQSIEIKHMTNPHLINRWGLFDAYFYLIVNLVVN